MSLIDINFRHVAHTPIEVWKVVADPETRQPLVMKCVIPVGTRYCMEINGCPRFDDSQIGPRTDDSYVSEILDVKQIGQWILSKGVAEYTAVEANNCLSIYDPETRYHLGINRKESGLWSYAYLWQPLWMTTKMIPVIKQAWVDGHAENYVADEWKY